MGKIINYFNSSFFNGKADTLLDWLGRHRNQEDYRLLFLNLDCTLRYIHDHGYSVVSFLPSEIIVLNDSYDCVQFTHLVELPADFETREKIRKDDIFNSCFLQVALFCDMVDNLTPQLLRERFDVLASFLPYEDVPYYRGVVERGASIYLYEYRLALLESNVPPVEEKRVPADLGAFLQKNYRTNSLIYGKISKSPNAAFVHFLIVPTIVFGLLFFVGLILLGISVFLS